MKNRIHVKFNYDFFLTLYLELSWSLKSRHFLNGSKNAFKAQVEGVVIIKFCKNVNLNLKNLWGKNDSARGFFQANKLDEMLSKYLNTQPAIVENNTNIAMGALPEHVIKCSSCGCGMVLRARHNNTSFISCLGYPPCRQSIWFPEKVIEVCLAPDTCVEVS